MTSWMALGAAFAADPAGAPPRVDPLPPAALKERLFAAGNSDRIVNFWATWCGPCVAEIPLLVAYAKDHPDVEVVMVNLDLPKLRQSHVVPFVQSHAPDHVVHVQLDSADPAKGIYAVLPDFPNVVPITLVVDQRGTVTQRIYRSLHPGDLPNAP